MENTPESTPHDQEPTPAKSTEQTHESGPARTHDAEITHHRVGPHPFPEGSDLKTAGEMADWFWANSIWPSIVRDHTENPNAGGV